MLCMLRCINVAGSVLEDYRLCPPSRTHIPMFSLDVFLILKIEYRATCMLG